MPQRHSRYVYRGDIERRRAKLRKVVLVLVAVVAGTVAWKGRAPVAANAEETVKQASPFAFGIGTGELKSELESVRGELDLTRAQLERANKVIAFSSRYRIGADLAGKILDASAAEGIEPELAFRLVKIESEFNPRATSPVGARGLTQLMLPTARFFDRSVTQEKLYDPETNLRIGFRYLRTLIHENEGNVKMALLVYNRGPVAVNAARREGRDPSNMYDRKVTKGFTGPATID
jgi:soluble lytic murein transglycosylase-like protein